MICQADENTIQQWREYGVPDDASTRDYAASLVLKLADERDEWREIAWNLIEGGGA